MTHQYHISTDDGSMDIKADSLADALRQFDLPESVYDCTTFCEYLVRCGGYGFVEQDGDRIAEIAKG